MRSKAILSRAALGLTLLLALASAAGAQLSRTWVSGTGDDNNPCSRTLPCKTFSGALVKTLAGGVIEVLDDGSYGGVTIDKSITIENEGHSAGIIATNSSEGIIVNAGAGDHVVLRGLSIEGLGTGGNGIRFTSGFSLNISRCEIHRVTGNGISFEPTGTSVLFVKDSVIRNSNFGLGGGILIKPGATGLAHVTLDHVRIERNSFGIDVKERSKVSIRDSEVSRNTGFGIRATSTAAGTTSAIVSVVDSLVSLTQGPGISADGVGAVIRIGDISIFDSAGAGLQGINGGTVVSFGDNHIAGNNPDGAPTSILSQQ